MADFLVTERDDLTCTCEDCGERCNCEGTGAEDGAPEGVDDRYSNYLRCAMWHWMQFQRNMARFYRSKHTISSRPELFRTSGSNIRDIDRCEACAEERGYEAEIFRSGSRTGGLDLQLQGECKWKDSKARCHENNNFDNNGVKEDECFQMDLDEDFKKFLEISERHRQERDKGKNKNSKSSKRKNSKVAKTDEKEADVDYIDVSKRPLMATTDAPELVDKVDQYRQRYGNHADQILNSEASIQMNFDKFCDQTKPVYWPYIPLKF